MNYRRCHTQSGVTFLDTADMYGVGANEELVGRVVRERREWVIVASKFGIVRSPDDDARGISGRPDNVRQACNASLRRTGLDVIDLYYQHRVDPDVPIEETVGAMSELVTAGKVKYLGLSAADIIENRPALSRWRSDHAAEFARYMDKDA